MNSDRGEGRMGVLQRAALLSAASLVGGTVFFTGSESASAAEPSWDTYQSSIVDSATPSGLPASYNVKQLHFGLNTAASDRFYFYLDLAASITADTYSKSASSYVGVNLDSNSDGVVELSLQTSTSPYVGTIAHAGVLVDNRKVKNPSSAACTPQTFSDVAGKASWIAFTIPRSCLPNTGSFAIQAQSVYQSNAASQKLVTKLLPSRLMTVTTPLATQSLSFNLQTTAPKAIAPDAIKQLVPSLATPSDQPEDLVSMASTIAASVVTIKCQSGQGSGWAANMQLPSTLTSSNVGSYIITANDVVKNCASDGAVSVILPNQQTVQGQVFITDATNNLASIVIPARLPPLDWEGQTPAQGWWTGVIGSPLGFPGVLTEGIVTSVSTNFSNGTTDAHLNIGNAGGPVFDRSGRAIGVALNSIANSEGFGQFAGAPLLCEKVIRCGVDVTVWNNAAKVAISTIGVSSVQPRKTTNETVLQDQKALQMATQDVLTGAKAVLNQSVKELQTAKSKFPSLAKEVSKLLAAAPKAPSLTGVISDDVQSITLFSQSAESFNLKVESTLTGLLANTKSTLTCVKGSTTKTVTGINPICPTGFKLIAKK